MTRIYHETSSGGKLRTKRRLGGFTLIELLVVVLIIGILAAVAWPKYELAIMKARMVEIYKWGDYASREAELFYLANGRYPSTFLELGVVVPGCNQSENYFNGCHFLNFGLCFFLLFPYLAQNCCVLLRGQCRTGLFPCKCI